MNFAIWLDVSLAAFGLLAVSPLLWSCLRRGRGVCSARLGRLLRAVEGPLFHTGVIVLVIAAIHVGWTGWKQESVLVHDSDEQATSAELLPSYTEAPDFSLPALDEDCQIRLSDFRGRKPVVLIFGSFS